MGKNRIHIFLIFVLVIAFSLCFINPVNAYYGMYGGLYGGMYGGSGLLVSGTGNIYNYPASIYNGYGYGYGSGLYGMYGGMYGGLYGGMYGGLYGLMV